MEYNHAFLFGFPSMVFLHARVNEIKDTRNTAIRSTANDSAVVVKNCTSPVSHNP